MAIPVSRLNTASRLAMLAERMAKLHAQVARDILAARSRRSLREAASQMEEGLRETTAIATGVEVRENYRLLRLLWDEYRPVALAAGGAQAARKLAERTEEVAWVAAKGARLLHAETRSRASDLVMLAGSARAAAQRLGKLHLLRGWALGANAPARDMSSAEAELDHALDELKEAPEARDEASLSLGMAQDQRAFLRQAVERLENARDRAVQLEHIAKTTDHIADAMDRVAKACEDAAG